jgi:hypothetical protein
VHYDPPATVTATSNVRIVVLSLAVICLAALAGACWLLSTGHDAQLPGSIATGAGGALGAILATTRSTPA